MILVLPVQTLLILTGCLGEAPDQLLPPRSSPQQFAFNALWEITDAQASFLAVEFEAASALNYSYAIRTDAGWDHSSTFVVHHSLLTKMNGSAVAIAGENFDGRTSCQLDKSPHDGASCQPARLETNMTAGQRNRLDPGRYLLLARAFGASRASIAVTWSSSEPVNVTQLQEGKTLLFELDENNALRGTTPFDTNLTWATEERFLASFRVAGKREAAPWFSAQGPTGNFSFRDETSGGGLYRDQAGRMAMEASLPGGPGTWNFSGVGGNHSVEGPSYVTVGIVLSPFFVMEDGSVTQYGPRES